VTAVKRLLIVVDDVAGDADPFPAHVSDRLEQFDEIRVVAPALNSPLESWASDDRRSVADAEARLRRVLGQLAQAGFAARGEVGDEDPALAVQDALHAHQADRVLIAHHAPAFERYGEHGVVERVREAFAGPVDEVQLDRAGHVVAHG
jgi:hypothetical protein